MDGERLFTVADAAARSLPGAALERPFGPDWEVYKVGGKVFMLCTEVQGPPMVIVKADPAEAAELRCEYVEITPGYHMNKRHWITVTEGDAVSPELVENLVADSYRLVAAGLPKADRPNVRLPADGRGQLDGARLQAVARKVAASLPDVTEGRPFVDKLDVYKAGGKVFLIVTDDPDEQIITVKADPNDGEALRAEFPSVTVGRYLDKHHWISLGAGAGVTEAVVSELVRTSYHLVHR